MPGVGLAPGSPVAAEDVRNLKRCTRHGPRRLRPWAPLSSSDQAEPVQGAHHLADRAGGHARVERRRVKLRVSKQHLNHTNIDILLQQVGRKAVPQRVQRNALVDLRQLRRAWQARFSWRVVSGLTGFWPGNSQATGLPMRYHSRKISSSMGESMAWRSLRPLPCSTRSSIRPLSISETFSDSTSEALSPAP